MEAEERIDRMLGEGLITPDQARRLRASVLTKGHPGRTDRRSRRRWLPLFAAAGVVTIALLLLFSGAPQIKAPVQSQAQPQEQQAQDVSQTLNQTGETGAMNRTLLNSIAVILLLIVPIVLLSAFYNSLVNREEAVLKSWAQVESQLQRRADLVPALIETVKGYVKHESATLSEVTASRGQVMANLTQSIDDLAKNQESLATVLASGEALLENQTQMDQLVGLQAALGKNLSNFIALAEDYPELRASDQFLELQAQLEGTENRINVARLRFNESVSDYNAAIRRLPGTLVAGFGNFRRKAYFQAEEGSVKAPAVDFN